MRKCSNFILLHLAGCPVFPAPLAEETVLCSLYILASSVILIYCKHGGLFLSSLDCSVNLCACLFVPVPYCFDYCSFVIYNLKSGTLIVSPALFSQDCFGNLGPSVVPCEF